MVIVLERGIPLRDRENLKSFLERNHFKVNEIRGEEETIFGAVGKMSIDPREVEILPGVDRVIPISKPYKMASREFKKEDTIVEIPNNWGQIIKIGGTRVTAIAGPCAVESREQMMEIAKRVSSAGAVLLRGGAYKPRTSPYAFQGMGEEGLKILKEAGDAYGLPIATEIVSVEHIPVMKDLVDVYQIGARNMQNFELLKRVGELEKPVILKRGLSATIEEWLMAAEYLLSSGTNDVILCERGIRTYEKATRNTLDLSAIPVLRSMTHLPIIVDPSHAVGIRDKVPPLALAAVAAGADGVIVEVHQNPDKAMSDGPQSLFPEQFEKLMRDIEVLSPVVGREVSRIRSKPKTSESLAGSDGIKTSLSCAYSGTRGAYAEQAILHYFDACNERLPQKNFREVFQAVRDGRADYGMIPIENTLAGSVYENFDNLLRFEDISITGSIKLRIEHALIGLEGSQASDIKTVFSHPQGIAQCADFLADQPWDVVETSSTSDAVRIVKEKNAKENAAIASIAAADAFKLALIKEGIEIDPNNYTRFILISATNTNKSSVDRKGFSTNESSTAKGKPMVSLSFSTKNEPGSLLRCLTVLHYLGLNMTRLESRPVQGEPWTYMFYTDIALTIGQDSRLIDTAVEELKAVSEKVRVLGKYYEIN